MTKGPNWPDLKAPGAWEIAITAGARGRIYYPVYLYIYSVVQKATFVVTSPLIGSLDAWRNESNCILWVWLTAWDFKVHACSQSWENFQLSFDMCHMKGLMREPAVLQTHLLGNKQLIQKQSARICRLEL